MSSNKTVCDVVVGRNSLPAEQSKAEIHECRAVAVGLVGDSGDHGRAAAFHLLDGLVDAILAHNGNVALALEFACGIDGAKRTSVRSSGDEDVLFALVTLEELGDDL